MLCHCPAPVDETVPEIVERYKEMSGYAMRDSGSLGVFLGYDRGL